MTIDRRTFLGAVGLGLGVGLAGGAVTPTAARRSAARPPRRLVMVVASGGWDTTYALDPKEPAYADVPAGATRRFGDLDVFCDASRPSVTAFFERFAPQSLLVRGVALSSVVHAECLKRMVTGTRVETSPDIGSMVARDLGNDLPLPYLVLASTAYTGPYAASAGRVGPNNQLAQLLADPAARPPGLAPPVQPTAAETEALRAYAEASADRARATRGAAGYNRRRVDDFAASIARADRLRGLRDRLGVSGDAIAMDRQIAIALDALEQDLSHAVLVESREPWDTHGENRLQGESHERLFGGLVLLAEELARRPGRAAGTTMADDTVVLVTSEFTRTPRLSSAAPDAGKEHWPVGAALLFGGGVPGGRVYGATTATSEPAHVDRATGAPAAAGERLPPADFVSTVLALCGADPAGHLPSGRVFDALLA